MQPMHWSNHKVTSNHDLNVVPKISHSLTLDRASILENIPASCTWLIVHQFEIRDTNS